jgi:catechol 2,3-dioxygenase-like lactoylglutathione lyase family enzyme
MKIEYRRINHVTLAVPAGEHEKVRAFYGNVLGLKEVERPDALNKVYDLIWYEWMDILLHIDFTPPWTKPAENRHVAVEVKQIHTVRAYLEQQGAEILEAVSMPDRERFYLLDPFGNYFEIMAGFRWSKDTLPVALRRETNPLSINFYRYLQSCNHQQPSFRRFCRSE